MFSRISALHTAREFEIKQSEKTDDFFLKNAGNSIH